jgi:hypothetical protein
MIAATSNLDLKRSIAKADLPDWRMEGNFRFSSVIFASRISQSG